MNRILSLSVRVILVAVYLNGISALAQQNPPHADHDHRDHSHSGEVLAFQLPEWKTMHFEDAAKAQQHQEMVAKLGCEVKQGQHTGHIDVSYRCREWKSIKVESHKLAEQWSGWLKSSGFDVSHGHLDPAYTSGKESVEFRLTKWKSIHGNGSDQEKKLISTLSRLGCEVNTDNHGNHVDIRYRSPAWRDVHVADHAQAEKLMAWLVQSGFEVAPHKH